MKKELAILLVTQLVYIERAIELEKTPGPDTGEYKNLKNDELRVVTLISQQKTGREYLQSLQDEVTKIESKKPESTKFGLLTRSHVHGTLRELQEYLDEKDLLTMADTPKHPLDLKGVAERLKIYGNTGVSYITYLTLGKKEIVKRLKKRYNISEKITIRESQFFEPYNLSTPYKTKSRSARTFYMAIMPTVVVELVDKKQE